MSTPPAYRRDELRCPTGVLFGVLRGPGRARPEDPEGAVTIEVKCPNRRCGAGPGVVVIHTFDIESAKCVRTDRFREPGNKARRTP